MNYLILLVEDDLQICEIICDYLSGQTEHYYSVECAHSGESGLYKIYEKCFDLVLLDIMLPEIDGFQLCRELRKRSDVPILFITARSREEDKLYGYSLGCDDYIVKPFSLPVLYAKIKAFLNRSKGMVQMPILKAGNLVLEPSKYLSTCNGKELELSCKEYELLKYLMEHKNKVCLREELLVNIWGYDFNGTDRVIDNHIKKLRKKLGTEQTLIKTVIKKGYLLEEKKHEKKEEEFIK